MSAVAEKTLLQADDDRYAAMLDGDVNRLGQMLAWSLVYTHSSAQVDDKNSYLASIREKRVRYVNVNRLSAHVVPLASETALMHGRVLIEADVSGQPKRLDNLYQSVWQRSGPNGYWQMVAWASTPIPPGRA